MAGTLYTYPENFRAWKVQVAAEYSGFNLKVDGNFKYGETNRTDEFQKKFPLGKVPAFESSDGLCLNESNAIASFVANESLLGGNKSDQCTVTQWMNFAESEILPAVCTWVFPCMGIMQFNKQNTERSKEELRQVLSVLNNTLTTRTFLVGERVTLADLTVACNLLLAYQWVLEPSFRQPYQSTNRWFETVINQPQFKKVIAEVKLCEKMAQFDAKKYAEVSGDSKKDKKKKEAPAKKEPKKEKPKEEPAEDEEPAAPVEKKAKDPFLQFPASETFILDEWKKVFSNEDTEVAYPWFMKNFDAEKFSIWKGRYMYNQDLSPMDFMNMNLLGGMIQRLEGMRKHAFGVHFLMTNPVTLFALYIARGPKLPFELSEDFNTDAGSYEWTQLDFKDEKTKELLKVCWACEGSLDGNEIKDYKDFK